ncbi:hypothetical protein SAMN04487968_107205 [Nocardioides terrae]|uniref:Uncharacterized protein n=1 Tax=Nocardioides terrae TaxID=574651 RepID=A0A1I1K7A6_9ACTN|nr:hypothetical protein [Nocardioides terrae]SFC53380.1 hypothetical protein SAMN04487968_107205 [Nocardioides terrae]
MASLDEPAAAPRLLVPILVIGLLVGVVAVLSWPAPGSRAGRSEGSRAAAPAGPPAGPPAASASHPSVLSRQEARAAGVLGEWDRRRAAAWAAGDAASLRALYVPGASAGEADVAMLEDWSARGLAVDALTTQLLAVRIVAHGPARWVLRVRDRVTGAVAAGAGLTEPLPAGATVEQRVVVRRVGTAWRVASVRPVGARS